MMEDDKIISEEKDGSDQLDVVESQLTIITTVADLENDLYDDCLADKIKVTARALRIIYKVQSNILKEI
jgi:hypothetical protein